jgi:hypothetical protein
MTDGRVVEVGPRDGLQNEKQVVPTATKLEFDPAPDRYGPAGHRGHILCVAEMGSADGRSCENHEVSAGHLGVRKIAGDTAGSAGDVVGDRLAGTYRLTNSHRSIGGSKQTRMVATSKRRPFTPDVLPAETPIVLSGSPTQTYEELSNDDNGVEWIGCATQSMS